MSAARQALRMMVLGLMVVCGCVSVGFAQVQSAPADGTGDSEKPTPESAFISTTKYTNEFFGFSFRIPKSELGKEMHISTKSDVLHFLYGSMSIRSVRMCTVVVMAKRVEGSADREAQEFIDTRQPRPAQETQIGGRKFWITDTVNTNERGSPRKLLYATGINGYVVVFDVFSFDNKLVEQWKNSFEGMTFFDPAKAREFAGVDSHRHQQAPEKYSEGDISVHRLSPGTISGNIYANNELGFAYEFPPGWVANDITAIDRAQELVMFLSGGAVPSFMRDDGMSLQCSRILLFVTKRPTKRLIGYQDDLILVSVVDAACLPDTAFPQSVDDQEGIKRIGDEMLQWYGGLAFRTKERHFVEAFDVQGHLMLELSGHFERPSRSRALDFYVSHELTQVKDYWLQWTFISFSPNGLNKLRSTRIKFEATGASPAAQQSGSN